MAARPAYRQSRCHRCFVFVLVLVSFFVDDDACDDDDGNDDDCDDDSGDHDVLLSCWQCCVWSICCVRVNMGAFAAMPTKRSGILAMCMGVVWHFRDMGVLDDVFLPFLLFLESLF